MQQPEISIHPLIGRLQKRLPFDIEYFLICVFGKIINQIKTSENPVKSILLSNFPFPQKYVFGRFHLFLGTFLGKQNPFWEKGNCTISGGAAMRKKGYKGRCEKKDLSKSQEVCRTYDAIQSNYADILQNDNSIQEIRCNVLMDGLAEGAYTSDLKE